MNTHTDIVSKPTTRYQFSDGASWFMEAAEQAMKCFFRSWGAFFAIVLLITFPKAIADHVVGKDISQVIVAVVSQAFLISIYYSLQKSSKSEYGRAFEGVALNLLNLAGLIILGLGVKLISAFALEQGHEALLGLKYGEANVWLLSMLLSLCYGIYILSCFAVGLLPYVLFLLMNRNQNLVSSLKIAICAFFTNIGPILAHGFIVIIAMIAATIPYFLGWIILFPILIHGFCVIAQKIFRESY